MQYPDRAAVLRLYLGPNDVKETRTGRHPDSGLTYFWTHVVRLDRQATRIRERLLRLRRVNLVPAPEPAEVVVVPLEGNGLRAVPPIGYAARQVAILVQNTCSS